MQTKYLSAAERAKGQKHYLRHAWFNGLNFPLAGDTVVYLLALSFSATNIQLGYLSSTLHITGLILPFVPLLFKGKNIKSVFFFAWIMRGAICLCYFPLLFVQRDGVGIYIILITYTLYCVFRTMGMSASETIQKTINTPKSLGGFMVKLFSTFNTSRLIAQVISFVVLSLKQLGGIVGLLILEAGGIFFNIFSTANIRPIPCREELSAGDGISTYRKIFGSIKKEQLQGFFLRWLSLLQFIIVGFAIPFLRRSVGLASSTIFIYTIVASSAVVFALWLIKPFIDRISSKSLLLYTSIICFICFCIWGILPPDIPLWVIIVLAVFTNGAANLLFMFSTRVLLRSLPEENKMEYFGLVNFSSAIFSLIGGITAGVLADLSFRAGFLWMNDYGFTFFFGAVVAVLAAIVGFGVKDITGLSVRETAQLIFSIRNLKAYIDVYQFSKEEDPEKRKILLRSITGSSAGVVTEEIESVLRNPLTSEKAEVLRTLFSQPREELLPLVLKVAAEEGSYTREEAIFALGAYPGEISEKCLLPILKDPDLRIRSSAAKSLGRIGCRDSEVLDHVRSEMKNGGGSIQATLNYTIALHHLDKEGAFLADCFKYPLKGESAQSYYSLLSVLLDFNPRLAELYQAENTAAGSGIVSFLENARELAPFLEDQQDLLEWLETKNCNMIIQWCSSKLSEVRLDGKWSFFQMAVSNTDNLGMGPNRQIALLYFTFHLLSISAEKPPIS
jgi:hypothetical protein